jgi:hypothetical protein
MPIESLCYVALAIPAVTGCAFGPNYQQAVLSLVEAQATRFGDTAALYQTGAFPHGVAE